MDENVWGGAHTHYIKCLFLQPSQFNSCKVIEGFLPVTQFWRVILGVVGILRPLVTGKEV